MFTNLVPGYLRLRRSARRAAPAAALAAVAAVAALAALPATAAPQKLEQGEFDPAVLDSLTGLYVRDGGVDYADWKAEGSEALDGFLASAGDYDLRSTMGKEPRVAFLLNAYNGWAVRQILDHYPVKSVQDIPGFFDKNTVRIAGEERTLNDVEALLAQTYGHHPLFLVGLSPGAKGMPTLPAEAFTSARLTALLGKQAGTYLGPKRLNYDQESNTLHVPPQFQRHWDLFRDLPKGPGEILGVYMPLSQVSALARADQGLQVVAGPVDWSLDDASGAPSGSDEGGQ